MRSYLDRYRLDRELFYHLPATAHFHAATNRLAFFPWELSREQYEKSSIVAEPLTVCDQAPLCDGAAAVLIRRPRARADSAIGIRGSAAISTAPGIPGPVLELELPAARRSARLALEQAGVEVEQVSVFDLHDSSSFIAALSIEAVGLAPRGAALERAAAGEFRSDGAAPLWTLGGLKARGNAPGASGLYQVVEAVLQLRGEAGTQQVSAAETALVQCLGSFGSTAVTHVIGG
jgi:acetyl-CoA C-acetyltransferase